jgi:hypothetical protein
MFFAGFGFLAFFLVVFGVGILGIVMLIVALVDMVRRPDWQWKLAGQEKILWILLVVLVNVFAVMPLIYWFSIRKKLIAVEMAAAAGQFGPGYMTPGGWQRGPSTPFGFGAPYGTGFGGPMWQPVPAAWMSDPSGEHRLRWWNGSAWTEHVNDDGPR